MIAPEAANNASDSGAFVLTLAFGIPGSVTMALILALRQVNGDLSNNQAKLKDALAKIEIDAPNGKIKLDANRQAIGTNFVTEVVDDGKGALFSKVVKVIPNVNQTLGYDPAVFAKIGLPSRTVPECKKY